MNTTQLECFLSVANFLNFSRAAEQLRLTQPAVSHQINTLENELGAKLFHRTSKRVTLTQEGYLFTQYAKEILALSRVSRVRLKESQEVSVTRFGVGCRSFLELRLLSPVLRQLRQEFPNLLPVLRLVPFDSLENQLEDGDVQVMFTFQESAPRRAVYRELARRPAVCLCAQDHPLAAHSRLTLSQLREAGGRFAAFPPHSSPPTLLALPRQAIPPRAPHPPAFRDHLEVLYTVLESGFAFAVSAALPQAAMPGIRAVPLEGTPPLSYGLAYPAGEMSPVLRRFAARMEELFGERT